MAKKIGPYKNYNPKSRANLMPAFDGTKAGPGRPPLPETVRERRAILRKRIEEISPDAIMVVNAILNDPRAENKDKLRAAEIALSHSLPHQEEVTVDNDSQVLPEFSDDLLVQRLEVIRADYKRSGGSGHSGGAEVAA